jgi:hypothetical protein
MKQVRLDEKKLAEDIRSAKTESDAVVAVYRQVYPEWDRIEKVGDETLSWPACNKTTWKRVCSMFMDLTGVLNRARAYDKQVMPGGVWMNNGFTQDESLRDWWVKPAPVKLKEVQLEAHV